MRDGRDCGFDWCYRFGSIGLCGVFTSRISKDGRMSLLSQIVDTFHKSRAAALVQGLFQVQASRGFFLLSPSESANELVSKAWALQPDVYDGRRGVRPHRVALAAAALAGGWDHFSGNRAAQVAVMVCLSEILQDVQTKRPAYNLSSLDDALFDIVFQEFVVINSLFEQQSPQIRI